MNLKGWEDIMLNSACISVDTSSRGDCGTFVHHFVQSPGSDFG